jgi:hypothetical protein
MAGFIMVSKDTRDKVPQNIVAGVKIEGFDLVIVRQMLGTRASDLQVATDSYEAKLEKQRSCGDSCQATGVDRRNYGLFLTSSNTVMLSGCMKREDVHQSAT